MLNGYFLAAMSSSRSDVPFFLLVSLKFLLVLKSFNGVSRLFTGCLTFSFNGVFGSFKEVSRKFQGYFKRVSWEFQGRLMGVSREISVGFKGI